MATSTMTQTVSGLFRDRAQANYAYEALRAKGFAPEDINLIMSDETRKAFENDYPDSAGSKALEGAGAGGAIGTITGGIIGAVAAIGTNLVMPGLGLVVAGPLAAGLAGAGAGGLTGGLIGALVGSGMPDEYATEYDRGVREGGVVLSVTPHSTADVDAVAREMKSHGATRVDRY